MAFSDFFANFIHWLIPALVASALLALVVPQAVRGLSRRMNRSLIPLRIVAQPRFDRRRGSRQADSAPFCSLTDPRLRNPRDRF